MDESRSSSVDDFSFPASYVDAIDTEILAFTPTTELALVDPEAPTHAAPDLTPEEYDAGLTYVWGGGPEAGSEGWYLM